MAHKLPCLVKVESRDLFFEHLKKAKISQKDIKMFRQDMSLNKSEGSSQGPAGKAIDKLRHLYEYHQFKGDRLITTKFLRKVDYEQAAPNYNRRLTQIL